jgi:hypothetical protein
VSPPPLLIWLAEVDLQRYGEPAIALKLSPPPSLIWLAEVDLWWSGEFFVVLVQRKLRSTLVDGCEKLCGVAWFSSEIQCFTDRRLNLRWSDGPFLGFGLVVMLPTFCAFAKKLSTIWAAEVSLRWFSNFLMFKTWRRWSYFIYLGHYCFLTCVAFSHF